MSFDVRTMFGFPIAAQRQPNTNDRVQFELHMNCRSHWILALLIIAPNKHRLLGALCSPERLSHSEFDSEIQSLNSGNPYSLHAPISNLSQASNCSRHSPIVSDRVALSRPHAFRYRCEYAGLSIAFCALIRRFQELR